MRKQLCSTLMFALIVFCLPVPVNAQADTSQKATAIHCRLRDFEQKCLGPFPLRLVTWPNKSHDDLGRARPRCGTVRSLRLCQHLAE